MTSILMMTLLFNNTVLLIKPSVAVNHVYVQYQLSNTPSIKPDDYKWIQMYINGTILETRVFRADLNKFEDMFIFNTR